MVQLRARAKSLGVVSRRKTTNQIKEDCRLALEAQQSEVQQEGRRFGAALDVGGSSFAGASSPSAAPAGGQEAERTKTVPGYSGTSMHTASTATTSDARRLAIGGNALGAAVAELSELSMVQLRARATSLGVAQRDERKKLKPKNRLKADCRRALEDNLAKMNAKDKLRKRLRHGFAHVQAKDKLRKNIAQVKAQDRLRKRDSQMKAQDRLRKRLKGTMAALEKRAELIGAQRAHANRKQETVCPGGTW